LRIPIPTPSLGGERTAGAVVGHGILVLGGSGEPDPFFYGGSPDWAADASLTSVGAAQSAAFPVN
jgi:hypothetical protein